MGGAGTLRHPEVGQRVKGVQLSPAESSSRHDGEVVQTPIAVFLLSRIRRLLHHYAHEQANSRIVDPGSEPSHIRKAPVSHPHACPLVEVEARPLLP
jgi:hypothetical protein